jgi:hypothetical protein
MSVLTRVSVASFMFSNVVLSDANDTVVDDDERDPGLLDLFLPDIW